MRLGEKNIRSKFKMNLEKIAENASKKAYITAKKFIDDAIVLSEKDKDIKTLADEEINNIIINELINTKIPIISEEIDNQKINISNRCWIIDPLDGTLNFSRQFPCSSISIALWDNNLPLLGLVKNIFDGTLYTSFLNKGTKKNSSYINVSQVSEINNAVLSTGFPSGANYESDNLLSFVKNIQKFKKIRAIGSASLMLAYVAEGVFDVYYEKDIYLWDVASGLSLVKEAGGEIFFKKTDGFKYEVLASNKLIFNKAKDLLIK
jgi:myo-inositol-1(or 4)-monophosphatase